MKRIKEDNPIEQEGYAETLEMTLGDLKRFAEENPDMLADNIRVLREYMEAKFNASFQDITELASYQITRTVKIERHQFKNYLIITVMVMGFAGNIITDGGILVNPHVILETVDGKELEEG